MKINELVNEINSCTSFKATRDEENKRLVVYLGDNSSLMTIKYNVEYLEDINIAYAYLDFYKPCGNLDNFYELINLVNEFVNTPVEERKPESKYRIRLKGFSSDDGNQYLTCYTHDVTRKLFACALNSDFKQEFTSDEINKIINRKDFRATWKETMVRAGLEPVENDKPVSHPSVSGDWPAWLSSFTHGGTAVRLIKREVKTVNNYYQIDKDHDLNDLLEMGLIKDVASFYEGNIFKYVYRHRNKNGLEDLKKARNYLNLLMELEYGAETEGAPTDEIDEINECLERLAKNTPGHLE